MYKEFEVHSLKWKLIKNRNFLIKTKFACIEKFYTDAQICKEWLIHGLYIEWLLCFNTNKKFESKNTATSGSLEGLWVDDCGKHSCVYFDNRQLQNVSCFANSLFHHKFHLRVKFYCKRFYYFSCLRKLFHKYRLLLDDMLFYNQDLFQNFTLFAMKLLARYKNVRDIKSEITFWTNFSQFGAKHVFNNFSTCFQHKYTLY